jgi:hypothetical protein
MALPPPALLSPIGDALAMAEPSATTPPSTYWAFISYSQKDEVWAKWLHRFIETYRVPKPLVGQWIDGRAIPARIMPIFRDRDELPSAANLNVAIARALDASSSLVVVCSPNAAASKWVNEEIRLFKSSGRPDRIFAIIVDESGRRQNAPASPEENSFPPALLHDIAADGTIVPGSPATPLAADVRRGKDGRANAALKIIAGILGVRFDDLRRREDGRRRHRLRVISVSVATGCAFAVSAYLTSVDAGLNPLGAPYLRERIDALRLSVFRPIATEQAIADAVSDFAADTRPILLKGIDPDSNVTFRLEWPGPSGAWEGSQALSALLCDPALPDDVAMRLASLVHRLFQTEYEVIWDGHVVGWWDNQRGRHARAEATFWVINAITTALERLPSDAEPERQHLATLLDQAQAAADVLVNGSDGSWLHVPGQDPPSGVTYVSALGLHALLRTVESGQGWRGDKAQALRMIAATTQWFETTFTVGVKAAGWGRGKGDEEGPNADLSLMVFGLLARSHAVLGTRMSPAVESAGLSALIQLADRAFTSSGPDLRSDGNFRDPSGTTIEFRLFSRLLWYPWAMMAAVDWIDYADRWTFPPHVRPRLERAFGHLATDLIRQVQRDLLGEHTVLYRFAETHYGVLLAARKFANLRAGSPPRLRPGR